MTVKSPIALAASCVDALETAKQQMVFFANTRSCKQTLQDRLDKKTDEIFWPESDTRQP